MATAATPVVFDFLGIVFTAILYAIYCVIFGLYWRIQLKRVDRRRKGVLPYALIAIFILCTAYFIIAAVQFKFYMILIFESLTGNSKEATPALFTVYWLTTANDALYIAIDIISQSILLYRCWIMWRQPLVMVIPCILSFAFLVIALTTFGIQVHEPVTLDHPPEPNWCFSVVTSFFFISLGVNALVTALIVYKITTVYNDIRGLKIGFQRGYGQHNLNPLISILIESGLITFVAQLALSIMYKYANVAFTLVSGIVVMLYGISTTVVLVRVEMGASCDHASMAVNSMNQGAIVTEWSR